MKLSFRISLGVAFGAMTLLVASSPGWAAVRTFDFDTPYGAYGNPDELCGNKPVPPLFNHPGMGAYTGVFLIGDVLPRDDSIGCGHGGYEGDFGSDSYLTGLIGGSNCDWLRFSWDFDGVSTWTKTVTNATWTESSKQLTQTGLFANENPPNTGTHDNAHAGDRITITGGSAGVVPGEYIVTSRVNDNTITLATSITGGAGNATSVTGTIRRDTNGYWVNMQTALFSYTTPLFPNPTVDIRPGSKISMKIGSLGFDGSQVIVPSAVLEYSLLIQETDLNLPLGEDGGTLGAIEMVGVDSMLPAVRTPVGGVSLAGAPDLYSISYQTLTWTFVDTTDPPDGTVEAVDVSIDGGAPVRKAVVGGFNTATYSTSDGILSTASNRGTLAGLAIRKPVADNTTVKWWVFVDDVVIEAPGITDPVKINVPVTEQMTKVTVSFIDPAASSVKLYKDSGSGAVLIATATPPYSQAASNAHQFTGLTALVKGEVLTATQVVDGLESTPSAPVLVGAFGTLEDFSSYPNPLDDAAGCQPRTLHNVSPIAWSYVRPVTWDGSNAIETYDGGWTNGIYAMYPHGISATGTFHVEAKLHVHEGSGGYNTISRYQVGVRTGPDAACAGGAALGACSIFGNYVGLTTDNNDALPPQIVGTQEFDGVEGEDILVAFSTDVQSGAWNGGSVTWSSPPDNNSIFIDDIKLIPGGGSITTCNDVPVANVAGPLLAGATTVDVEGVGTLADYVTVYVNGVKRGMLDVRTTAGGRKTVTLDIGGTYALRIGDVVTATQTYPETGNPSNEIEGCQAARAGTVGTGSNQTPIMLTLGLRETGATVGLGQDAGVTNMTNGGIEWLGATTVIAGAPQGKLIYPSTAWQTVTFVIPHNPFKPGTDPDPLIAYEAGNGQLNAGTFTKRGAFEHLAVSIPDNMPNSGPYVMWFDNVKTESTVIGNGFESCLPVTDPPLPYDVGTEQVMFRFANYLSGFAPYFLSSPCESFLDDSQSDPTPQAGSDPGTRSVKMRFQFSQEHRWARLTTYCLYGTPSPYYPNPCVSFTPLTTVSVRVLYPPPEMVGGSTCANPPTVTSITPNGSPENRTDVAVQIVGTNFPVAPAPLPQVKLHLSGSAGSAGDVIAKSVTVTDAQHLTAVFDLGALGDGAWDVMVGTCAYGVKAAAFTICGNPTVTAINPTSGATNSAVKLVLTGTYFKPGATTVKLVKAGQADIVATNVVVSGHYPAVSSKKLTAEFTIPPLADPAAIGAWDVVVENCGGSGTMAAAFTMTCGSPVVNGPLKAGATTVTVSGIVAAPQAVTIYAGGSPIGTKTSGFAGTGTETVTVSPALLKDRVITASQTVGGVESCIPAAGAVVGSGGNAGLSLTLGIREDTTLTGPIGADGGTKDWGPPSGVNSTFIRSWLVLSPGSTSGYFSGAADWTTSHNTDWLDNVGGEAAVTPAAGDTVPPRTGQTVTRTWRQFTAAADILNLQVGPTTTDGPTDPNAVYPANPDVVTAYVVSYILNTGDSVAAKLKYGSDDAIKIWWNGQLVKDDPTLRGCVVDQNTSPAFTCCAGWNTLVMKVTDNASAWACVARLVDAATGNPIPSIEATNTKPASLTNACQFEWLGATGVVNGVPQGQVLTPGTDWQTVTFQPNVVQPGPGGNGVLNGTYGVLADLAVTPSGTDTGPYTLYIDNVVNGSTSLTDFESFAAGTEVLFRPATQSAVTAVNVLPGGVNAALVDDTKGDASAKSDRAMFQPKDLAAGRYARLTTSGAANLPNAVVDLTQPITMRVLLAYSCPAPVVTSISPNKGVQGHGNLPDPLPYNGTGPTPGVPVHATIHGSNFGAGATVKLTQSGKADLNVTNVVVVDASTITADIDLNGAAPGALDGAWDVVVHSCGDGSLPAGFTVSMCFSPREDIDGDGDIDLGDFSIFQGCFNGPNRPYNPPPNDQRKCACFDVGDNPTVSYVDLADFGAFQGCFNGPNRPKATGCAY
jgi:hypothetical protein